MPKLLTRIVALLLVPCLVVDPIFATAMSEDLSGSHFSYQNCNIDPMVFSQQALSERLAAATFIGKTDNALSHSKFHALFLKGPVIKVVRVVALVVVLGMLVGATIHRFAPDDLKYSVLVSLTRTPMPLLTEQTNNLNQAIANANTVGDVQLLVKRHHAILQKLSHYATNDLANAMRMTGNQRLIFDRYGIVILGALEQSDLNFLTQLLQDFPSGDQKNNLVRYILLGTYAADTTIRGGGVTVLEGISEEISTELKYVKDLTDHGWAWMAMKPGRAPVISAHEMRHGSQRFDPDFLFRLNALRGSRMFPEDFIDDLSRRGDVLEEDAQLFGYWINGTKRMLEIVVAKNSKVLQEKVVLRAKKFGRLDAGSIILPIYENGKHVSDVRVSLSSTGKLDFDSLRDAILKEPGSKQSFNSSGIPLASENPVPPATPDAKSTKNPGSTLRSTILPLLIVGAIAILNFSSPAYSWMGDASSVNDGLQSYGLWTSIKPIILFGLLGLGIHFLLRNLLSKWRKSVEEEALAARAMGAFRYFLGWRPDLRVVKDAIALLSAAWNRAIGRNLPNGSEQAGVSVSIPWYVSVLMKLAGWDRSRIHKEIEDLRQDARTDPDDYKDRLHRFNKHFVIILGIDLMALAAASYTSIIWAWPSLDLLISRTSASVWNQAVLVPLIAGLLTGLVTTNLVHEIGHALTLIITGIGVKKFTLIYTEIKHWPQRVESMMYVTNAGVLFNLMLVAILSGLTLPIIQLSMPVFLSIFLWAMFVSAISLSLLALLQFIPFLEGSDGNLFVRSSLILIRGNFINADDIPPEDGNPPEAGSGKVIHGAKWNLRRPHSGMKRHLLQVSA